VAMQTMQGMTMQFDPSSAADSNIRMITSQIFDTLVTLDYDTLEVLPSLATSWNMPDEMTVEMELRQGVYFHNGQPLTAHDVQFTIDDWVNVNPNFDNRAFAGMIERVEVHDDHNFTIHLNTPFAPILRYLTTPALSILPGEHFTEVGSDAFAMHPIGTGAFAFGHARGDRVTLSRNPDYWGDLAGVESLLFVFESNPFERWEMVYNGEVDIMLHPTYLDARWHLREDFLDIQHIPSMTIDHLVFNMGREPWGNPLVTQAVRYAMDTEAILAAAFGFGTHATIPVPDTVWGHADVERV